MVCAAADDLRVPTVKYMIIELHSVHFEQAPDWSVSIEQLFFLILCSVLSYALSHSVVCQLYWSPSEHYWQLFLTGHSNNNNNSTEDE